MNLAFLANHPNVSALPITKFRCIRKMMKTNWWNFTKISGFEAPLHMQLLNLLQLPFPFIPALLHIIANLNITLHILLTKGLKSPSSLQYTWCSKSKRVINWTDYWQHHSFSQRSFILLYFGGECILPNFPANSQSFLVWKFAWSWSLTPILLWLTGIDKSNFWLLRNLVRWKPPALHMFMAFFTTFFCRFCIFWRLKKVIYLKIILEGPLMHLFPNIDSLSTAVLLRA